MNSIDSGIHHFATRPSRKPRMSSGLRSAPSSGTTQASGRSPHFSSWMPITAASLTCGWAMISFSSSTEEIHSPPDFTRSLVRSTSLM